MVEFSRDREIQGFIDLLGCSTSVNEKPVPLILNSQYVLNFVFLGVQRGVSLCLPDNWQQNVGLVGNSLKSQSIPLNVRCFKRSATHPTENSRIWCVPLPVHTHTLLSFEGVMDDSTSDNCSSVASRMRDLHVRASNRSHDECRRRIQSVGARGRWFCKGAGKARQTNGRPDRSTTRDSVNSCT